VELLSARGDRAFLVVLRGRDHVASSELRAAVKRWRLTGREAEVVALVAEGEANKVISEKLGVALRTVEVHVASVLKKAKVDSRARLIAYFWTRR
jgi:two-component system response regulator DctR